MNKEELVNGLIANEATQFTDDDKEWLNGLDEERLKKMAPPVIVDAEADAEAERIAAEAETARLAALESSGDTPPVTTEDYIANAPEEVQQVLNSGLQMHRSRKEALVAAIKANARNTFSEEQLQAKPLTELESIAALSTDVSFEGGGANISTLRANQDETPAPLQVFDLNPQQNADAA
ncbi:hypothetical protein LCGC14_2699820 [marine sediment metagenome]|uniref:Uncharacterized protein n=1 Tax=marine sediment metagenome TaxID=412755 RepID=A0A0F8ZFZ8_9ZZZZ